MNDQSILNLLQNKNVDFSLIINKVRSLQVHEIIKGRRDYGEYHHLFPLLRKYPNKFKEYVRMEIITFDYVLSKIDTLL